jgi:hypothetical protein
MGTEEEVEGTTIIAEDLLVLDTSLDVSWTWPNTCYTNLKATTLEFDSSF